MILKIRPAEQSDIDKLAEIYVKFYEREFPLNLKNITTYFVAEKDGELIGFLWIQLMVEANIMFNLECRQRDKFEALKELFTVGEKAVAENGFDQVHVFPADPKFAHILKKHLGFESSRSSCLVLNIKDENG